MNIYLGGEIIESYYFYLALGSVGSIGFSKRFGTHFFTGFWGGANIFDLYAAPAGGLNVAYKPNKYFGIFGDVYFSQELTMAEITHDNPGHVGFRAQGKVGLDIPREQLQRIIPDKRFVFPVPNPAFLINYNFLDGGVLMGLEVKVDF